MTTENLKTLYLPLYSTAFFFLSLFTMTVFYSSITAQVYASFFYLQSNVPKEQTHSQAQEFKLYQEVRRQELFFFHTYFHLAPLSLCIPGKLEMEATQDASRLYKVSEETSRE